MKYWLIISIVFISILLIIYARIQIIISGLDFDYKVSNFDTSKLSLTGYSEGQGTIPVDCDIDIMLINKTSFSTKVDNLIVKITDSKGLLVAETTTQNLSVIINPKATTTISCKLRMYASIGTLTFISSFLLNKNTNVGYKVSCSWKLIPISTSGIYTYTDTPSGKTPLDYINQYGEIGIDQLKELLG